MSKKKVFLGTCGAVVLLLGGGGLAVNHFVNPEMIRTQLYQTLEKQTGKKITLSDFTISVFPWPEIKASTIELSNVPNGKAAHFVTADHLTADLSLWALFHKEIRFSSIELSNVKLYLERNKNGDNNWQSVPSDSPAPPTTGRKSNHSPHQSWKLRFNNIKFNQVDCWFDDQYSNKSTHLYFDRIKIHQVDDNKVNFDVKGDHNKTGFTVSGQTDHLNELLGNKDFSSTTPIKFKVNFAEYDDNQKIATLYAGGSIKDLIKGRGYDLVLRGTLSNLNSLNQLFPHARLPSVESIMLNIAVEDSAADTDPMAKPKIKLLQLNTGKIEDIQPFKDVHITSTQVIANKSDENINTQITGQINGNMFRWSGDLGTLSNFQKSIFTDNHQPIPIKGNLSSNTYNAQLEGTIGGINPSVSIKLNALNYHHLFDSFGDVTAQDIVYTGTMSLPFSLYKQSLQTIKSDIARNFKIDGKLASGSFQLGELKFNQFSTDFIWKDNVLTLAPFNLSGKNASAIGTLSYSANNEDPTLTVQLYQALMPMQWVENQFKLPSLYSGPVEIFGTVSTTGKTKEEKIQNLNGTIGLTGTDGVLNPQGLQHYIGKAAKNLSLKESLSAQCLVLHTTINKQSAYFDTMTLQTKKVALNGTGTFNIANQTLDMHFTPDIMLGAFNASSPLRIGGTLSNPNVIFDTNKNKVFTLSINPFKKSMPPTNYCTQALQKAKRDQKPIPAGQKSP